MTDNYSKYQYNFSNKTKPNNYNNYSFKVTTAKSNDNSYYNNTNNVVKSARTQNIKNVSTSHINIDLSKYNNNTTKAPLIINNSIKRTKTIETNKNLYNSNNNYNNIKNESKSRYVNRSTRRIDDKNKIRYKKVYINLNKEKQLLNIEKENKNNSVINIKNTDNKRILTNHNFSSIKSNNNNIIFNNKLTYIKKPNNIVNEIKQKENNDKNKKSGDEFNKIENIYLNIHNNNVIKNNNNILIKPNEINYNKERKKDEQKLENKNPKINTKYININVNNFEKEEEEEENIIKDDDDIQENFCYDKNEINENIYSNINKNYLQKYINNNQKKEDNSFPKDRDVNTKNIKTNYCYVDYIKNEEQKLDEKNNTNDSQKNIIKEYKNEKDEKQNNDEYYKRNKNKLYEVNKSFDSGTNSSIANTFKLKDYGIYYGKSNNKDIIRESTNIKNEKEFKNLMPKTSFQKFLTSKIKYYMNEESIPKQFISEFIQQKDNSKKNNHIKLLSDIHNSKNKEMLLDLNLFNEYYENKYIIPEINRSKSKKQKKKENLLLKQEKEELSEKIEQLKIYIDNSKKEMEQRDNKMKNYFESFDRITTENEQNKKIIENLEKELKLKNYEVEEKRNEIIELNNINNNLEYEMKKLKEEYINEAINNRETKENYIIIKNNYNDIKNQYDLLNIKYKTLSDENYNFKRDKILYEKELKSKNVIIDDLIEDNSRKKELKGQLNKLELNDIEEKQIKKFISSNKKERKEKEDLYKEQSNKKEVKKKETFFEKLSIEELMNLRDELIGERTSLTNEFYKIPIKANIKQKQRRNELEQRLSQINNKLAKIRIRINILKDSKNNK